MTLTLEQLRGLEAVARTTNVTRAAAELFVSQPTLSRQLAALEAELGVELLHRGRGGAHLTDAGRALLPIARRMLADAATAAEAMRGFSQVERGRVVLGAPPTLCVSVVAEALADFRLSHPGVELVVHEAGSRQLRDVLAEGGVDLALTVTREQAASDPAVDTTPLFTEELVVASSAAAPAPQLGPDGDVAPGRPDDADDADGPDDGITLAALARLPQVVFNRGYDLRVATEAAFVAAGLTPVVAVEGAEMDAVLRFVERGVGVAVVPATILIGRPGLRGTRLSRPALTRTVVLSRRAGLRPSPASAALERALLAVVDRMVEEDHGAGALMRRA
ncbi:LysR family transcriptional regulator [Serinibacter arcticus]|uniref:LysR family transcriptional regulator n=1 Tax=Serinibacter arcticus TaxID=1655435 RepID=A0A2U1ZTK9_9MICO|nr:LysR substrate-binding domain-containing protein [Serinibacter arcticus]PWD50262.1 LysR family transcriptional regulator [Serinibacter arcticus]